MWRTRALLLLHLTIAYRPPADRAGIKAIACCCPRVADDQQHKASLKGRLFSLSLSLALFSTSWLQSHNQWNLSGALPSGSGSMARLHYLVCVCVFRQKQGAAAPRMVRLSLARKAGQKEKEEEEKKRLAFGGTLWLNWRAKPPSPLQCIVRRRRRRRRRKQEVSSPSDQRERCTVDAARILNPPPHSSSSSAPERAGRGVAGALTVGRLV